MEIRTLLILFLLLPQLALADFLGTFRNTYYYLAQESRYDHLPLDAPLLDMEGDIISWVSNAYRKSLIMEGSGRLRDGRVVNYAGKKDNSIRFRVTANPHGDGIGTCALVPFGTIAVDPKRIQVGSIVQIKETAGMILPDGTRHDGLWRADDVGGAIQGDRIDLFLGDDDRGETLKKHKIRHLQPLTLHLVSLPGTDHCVHE